MHLDSVKTSLDMASDDLERAFKHFLENRPDKNKPIIVAGHSQGGVLMTRVLARQLQGTEHEEKLVAAYLCGSYLPKDLFGTVFTSLKACSGPTDTKCIIAYDTRTPSFKPESMNNIISLPYLVAFGLWGHHLYWLLHDKYCERPTGTDDVGKPRLQINPGTWQESSGGEYLGASVTSTGVNPRADHITGQPIMAPAGWAEKTVVNHYSDMVADTDEFWQGAHKQGNLHSVDVQFWFYNHRENVKRRLNAWFEQEQSKK